MSHEAVNRSILQRLAKIERRGKRFKLGVITAISPLTVSLGGGEPIANVQAIQGTGLFAVDDVVAVDVFGNDLLIQGRIGAPSGQSGALVTALPATATAGLEIVLQTSGMAALTVPVMWRLRGDGTKWCATGCAPIFAQVNAGVTPDEATSSTSYVDLATGGPSIIVPVAGVYQVEIGFAGFNSSAGARCVMSYAIGGTGAVDGDSVMATTATASADVPRVSRIDEKTLAAVTLISKYAVSGGTGNFRGARYMRLTPIRLG